MQPMNKLKWLQGRKGQPRKQGERSRQPPNGWWLKVAFCINRGTAQPEDNMRKRTTEFYCTVQVHQTWVNLQYVTWSEITASQWVRERLERCLQVMNDSFSGHSSCDDKAKSKKPKESSSVIVLWNPDKHSHSTDTYNGWNKLSHCNVIGCTCIQQSPKGER